MITAASVFGVVNHYVRWTQAHILVIRE